MSIESSSTENTTLHPEDARKIRARISKWGRDNYQYFPWRNPGEKWHGLIAEILLQRTRAKNVIPVYEKFISAFPDLTSLANAPIYEVESIIFPLGLHWRAPFLKKLGEQLQEKNGVIPENYSDLLTLSGIGDYVASAWLSFHGGKRLRIVDANIVRFICRITGNTMDGETRRQKWLIEIAESLTPVRNWRSYNFAILDFTMLVCAKKPQCHICPVGPRLCVFGNRKIGKGL